MCIAHFQLHNITDSQLLMMVIGVFGRVDITGHLCSESTIFLVTITQHTATLQIVAEITDLHTSPVVRSSSKLSRCLSPSPMMYPITDMTAMERVYACVADHQAPALVAPSQSSLSIQYITSDHRHDWHRARVCLCGRPPRAGAGRTEPELPVGTVHNVRPQT